MNPMHTAAAIARLRAEEGSRPEGERLFVDPLAHLFDDAHADVEAVFGSMPFFREQVRLRTRFIDDAVRDALAADVRNVVFLGAGFDTRAFRMPELSRPGVRIVEVDHPAQIADKRRILAAHGVEPPATLAFVPADLGSPDLESVLSAGLQASGIPASARVLWVCEGLLGYLSPDAVQLLAEVTCRLSGSSSRLMANHLAPLWSPAALAEVFRRAGWDARPGPSFEELHRKWIGEPVPPGSDYFAFLVARQPEP